MSWRKLEGAPADRCDHGWLGLWGCELRLGHPGSHHARALDRLGHPDALHALEQPRPALSPHNPLLAGLSLREIVEAMRADVRRTTSGPEGTVTAGYAEELLCALELRVGEAITRRLEHARRRGALVAPAIGAETELESLRDLLAVFLRQEGF